MSYLNLPISIYQQIIKLPQLNQFEKCKNLNHDIDYINEILKFAS